MLEVAELEIMEMLKCKAEAGGKRKGKEIEEEDELEEDGGHSMTQRRPKTGTGVAPFLNQVPRRGGPNTMNGSDNVMDAGDFLVKGAGLRRLFVLLIGLVLGGSGCDRKAPEQAERTQSESAAGETVAKPGGGEKLCFQCNGTGRSTCLSPGCKDGFVECPGPCLKLSKGKWEHMHVDGHPDTDVWQKFKQVDGTSQSWNQAHVGEVIDMRGAGMAVNIGKCPVCGGQAKVACKACNGTGKLNCPICDGKKVVPESWTAFNNPKVKNPPATIQLKDGRTIYGKIESRLGTAVYVRTESGKQEEFQARDIVSPAAR